MHVKQEHSMFHLIGTMYLPKCIHNADSFHKSSNSSQERSLKPIFHCNAKSFALGTFASPNTKDSTFALPNFFAMYEHFFFLV